MTQTTDHLNPETLSAFIDGELPPNESQAAQQHLAECHQCTLQVVSAMQMKTATARAGQRFSPTPAAMARLTAALQTHTAKTSVSISWLRPTVWVGLAAALVLAVALVGWQQYHHANALSAELLDQHLGVLSSAAPEVISTDRHTVKPWFQGKLPFSFNLPDALPADTALKGGDLAYLNGQPVALLLYTIHQHTVSVFLTQRSAALALPSVRSGFTIRSRTTHDLSIIAVSDVNPADLDLLMSAIAQAQSPL
jgi:anti-sigma factor RsiW